MSLSRNQLYVFGPFTLDAARRVLRREGALVQLPPKAVDLLCILAESAGEVVTKDELMRRLWPDTFVEESNLAVNVFTLRKALGGDGDRFIITVPKRGYQFVGELAPEEPTASSSPSKAVATVRWRTVAGIGVTLAAVVATLSFVRTTPEGSAVLPGTVQSLAVLPFAYSGGETADEYIGPGFSSAVSSALAHLRHVIVRPMPSTLKFGGAAQDPIEAGRALQVDLVLQGSMRRTGERLQLSATLVRVTDGRRIWESSTSEAVTALPTLERVLAGAVAAAVTEVTDDERVVIGRPRTSNIDAYLSYLRGRDASHYMTPRDTEAAVAAFTRAAEADATFADAHAALATFLTLPMNSGPTLPKYEQGIAAATRALALNNRLAEPHVVLGRAAVVLSWDWSAAEREYEAAIAAAPYDPEPHFWYAVHLGATGRHDDAIAEIRFAQQMDPSSPRINLYAGMLLLLARRYDEAISQLRKTPLEMGVFNQQVYLTTASALMKKGRLDEALATTERGGAGRAVQTTAWLAHRAYFLAAAGRTAEARQMLIDLEKDADPVRPSHTIVAAAYACAGQLDEAFSRLERAYAARDSRIVFLNVDPLMDCARPDPRFAALVRRIGLDPAR